MLNKPEWRLLINPNALLIFCHQEHKNGLLFYDICAREEEEEDKKNQEP